MKKGDTVTQILPAPIVGTVEGFAIDQDTGEKLVLVVADGLSRYFKETEVQVSE